MEVGRNLKIDDDILGLEYISESNARIKKYSSVYNYVDSSEYDYVPFITELGKKNDLKKYLEKYLGSNPKALGLFAVPKEIMFLNFNYTDTLEYYLPEESSIVRTISIHGQLGHEDNPIIFGYGDEICSEYKAFENSAEDEFLKNAKSIRYLETDNYRKLIEFADSDKFQVFLFGHSCGLSDRTLLNTLFEHKNCVSIKPFYYVREDKTDDYNDIVRNISRNFTDKVLMRNRVVNKTYCTTIKKSAKD